MMRLWTARQGENQIARRWAADRPGSDWCELARDLLPGETVEIVDGKAEIVPAPERPVPDPRRAAIAVALPDILLAVAEGAELREEVRKVLEGGDTPDG